MSLERQFLDHILSPSLAHHSTDSAVGQPLIGATWVDEYPRVCQWHARTRRRADTWRQGTPQTGLGYPPHPHLSIAFAHMHTHLHAPSRVPSPSPLALWKQHHVPDTESAVAIRVSGVALFAQMSEAPKCMCARVCASCLSVWKINIVIVILTVEISEQLLKATVENLACWLRHTESGWVFCS